VICVSNAEADLVRQHFPWVGKRITTIPNGVDVQALRAATAFPEQGLVILSAGRLEGYKNVQRIIEALAYLSKAYVLRIVGEGPDRERLEQVAKRLGLQDRVAFLGKVSDEVVRRWFRTARVYVSMSAHEAFGITLYEALAVSARVVASDVPAHRDVAQCMPDQVTLVEPQAAAATLARLIQRAAEQPRLEATVLSLPSWSTVAEQTLTLYDTLWAATNRPRLASVRAQQGADVLGAGSE
jgi:glycosyltransferase involved in cell wall biosynthesis